MHHSLNSSRGGRPHASALGALAVAALALAAGNSVARAQPTDVDDWLRVDAAGFVLYSNAEPEVARRVARGLEGFRTVFGRLAPELAFDSAAPTVVFAFRDAESYAPYRHDGGPGGQVVGQLSTHPDGNAILLDASGELLDALPVIYHESVHELVRLNFPSAPLWFHEGLAEYYSTLRIGEDSIEIGAPVERHVARLRAAEELELGEIVRLVGDASALGETEHVGRVYAVSWALVHHLLSDGEDGSTRIADFLIALHEGLAPEAAFDVAFPQGVRAIEEELRLAVAAGAFSVSEVSFGGLGGLSAGRSRAAPPADVLTRLGFLLARSKRAAEAERHFDLALAYEERHPGALVGLAHLRSQAGRLDEARAWFEQALEGEGFDAEGWLLYGKFLLAAAERARDEGRAADFGTALEDARVAFSAAAAAFPGFVEARALLGASYLYDGDPSLGIEELVWARRRAPARSDLAFWLALLYIRSEELDRAEKLIAERLDPVEHGEMYRQAIEALERTHLLKNAEQAFTNGDPETGLALLEQAIDRTTASSLRRQLEARYEQLREAHGNP